MTDGTNLARKPLLDDLTNKASLPHNPGAITSLLICGLVCGYLILTSASAFADFIPGIWLYDTKRVYQFILLFLLFTVALSSHPLKTELTQVLDSFPAWMKYGLLVVMLWGFVSSLFHAKSLPHALTSLSEVALYSSLCLSIPVIAACRQTAGRSFDLLALGSMVLLALAVGLEELLGVIAAHHTGQPFSYTSSLLYFSHPRFYNQIQSWILPATPLLTLLLPGRRSIVMLCAIVLGLQWYIVLMTGARGTFLSVVVSVATISLLFPGVRRFLLKWLFAGFLIACGIYLAVLLSFESAAVNAGAPDIESRFFAQSLGRPMTSSSARYPMWMDSAKNIISTPLLGTGPMNFACMQTHHAAHPHNFALQIAQEWGLPSFLILISITLSIFARFFTGDRKKSPEWDKEEGFSVILLAGVLAAVIHSCLSGIFVMPASQVSGILLLGMLLAVSPTTPGGKPSTYVLLFGLTLSLGLIAYAQYELNNPAYTPGMHDSKQHQSPRIWQDSDICRTYIK